MKFKSKKNEITIAIIGLIGILLTGVLSNWDKIFPDPEVIIVSFSGYRETGNFETELRYYFEVSGVRATMENMQQQLANSFKIELTAQYPENREEIDAVINVALKEAITLDEVIKKLLPVYRKHFTVQEIQELNRFYSTEIMQNMINKMPLLTQEMAPLQVELFQDFERRFETRLEEIYQD
jgi:hypothetical protein